MAELVEKAGPAPQVLAGISGHSQRRLKIGCFILAGLNSLAGAYYFNYLFFYMREHFGFGNRENLLLTSLYGFIYMLTAWNTGGLGQRLGYFVLLRAGFSGTALAMVLGGLAPVAFGYSRGAMFAELAVMAFWTVSICVTWPTLQTLLSRRESPRQLAWTAGMYNIVWASAAAIAYLTGGALLDKFGGETLFWVPVAILAIQLALLARLRTISPAEDSPPPIPDAPPEPIPPLNPRPIAKAKTFLYLAWLGNPFAYIGIYGILPVIPKLSEQLGLTPTYAGFLYSVWFWVRLAAFAWFSFWPGWHYRFSWLLGAFLALIASFLAILLATQIWLLLAAQVAFGLAVGLMYHSSLFYSMDVGASRDRRGGIHESAIGMGIFLGPAVGVTALRCFTGSPNAGAWSISGLLLVGLALFLMIKYRRQN